MGYGVTDIEVVAEIAGRTANDDEWAAWRRVLERLEHGESEVKRLRAENEMHRRARQHLTELASKKERRAEKAEAEIERLRRAGIAFLRGTIDEDEFFAVTDRAALTQEDE